MARLVTSALRSPRLRYAYYRASRVPVIRSVQRQIARKIVPSGEVRWTTLTAGRCAGLQLLVDPRSEVGYLRGDHEPWLQDLLADWLRPGDHFHDVGAHVGFFSLVAARLVGPSGQVVALEPDPRSHGRLLKHVERNGMSSIVRPIQAAAWSSDGTVPFTASPQDAGVTGAVSEFGRGGVMVKAIRLDDLDGSPPAVIKLDVEGGEVEALRGATRILGQRRTRWVIEVHSEDHHHEVRRVFAEAGYEVMSSQPRHPTYSDYEQTYVFARPPT